MNSIILSKNIFHFNMLSSVYKIRAQKYNLGDMSQKWIFFDGQKSAKKADFGVFGTFLPFFWKIFKIFKISIFSKSYVLGLFCAKNMFKRVKITKKYFFVENFWKIFFWHFLKKKCQKGRFWRFWHFFAFFLKKFENLFLLNFLKKRAKKSNFCFYDIFLKNWKIISRRYFS